LRLSANGDLVDRGQLDAERNGAARTGVDDDEVPPTAATNNQRLSGDQTIDCWPPSGDWLLPGAPIRTSRFLVIPVRRSIRCTVSVPPNPLSGTAAVVPSGAITPMGGQEK